MLGLSKSETKELKDLQYEYNLRQSMNIPDYTEIEKKHREYGLCIIDVIRKNYDNDSPKDKEASKST